LERFTTLERVRSQREARQEPRIAVIGPDAAVAPAVDGADATRLSAIVDVDRKALERHRVLEPGASGTRGAPYKMLRTQVLKRLDQLSVNTLGSSRGGETKS